MDIEVWYGSGGRIGLGPIEAEFVEAFPNGEVRFRITDPTWLEHVGWDGPVEYTYGRLCDDGFVRYDAYAWCPKGGGPEPTKWW